MPYLAYYYSFPKVSIYIPGSMRGTISDSNGNFYIDAKPKETLYFTYAGKEDAYRQLQEKDTTGFIVQMQPRIQRLKNVHVRKDKKIIEKGEPYEDDRDGTFELVYADAYFPNASFFPCQLGSLPDKEVCVWKVPLYCLSISI